jgi:hypothetical protein
MLSRVLIGAAALLSLVSQAQARSCHIVECQQVRSGEICSIQPCNSGVNLICVSGRYTVGDGYRVFRGGSQSQCEQRCAADPNCNFLEYNYGREGVKCNLYASRPTIRWNSSYDATVCAWE